MIDFSDEEKLAQRALRQWATTVLQPRVAELEAGTLLPYELARGLIRTFGIDELVRARFERGGDGDEDATVPGRKPRGAGGVLGDPGLMAIVSIELSRVCPGFCLSFGASLGLAGGAILAKGTPAQRRRWALPILTGERIGAWAMTEPEAGSDAFGAMRTTARRDPDRDGGFVLSGAKTFITNAPFADTFVVYAKLADDAGAGGAARSRPFHAFVVDKGTPGLRVGAPMAKMGMNASPTGELFLDDVRVGREQLLGETLERPARDEARDVFHGERTAMAPMCLGIIERCLEDALAYAQQRHTWGKPIAEYQLVQDKLARMFVARENVRNLLFRQLEKQARGVAVTAAEASACKLYCARAATDVAMEAVQLMGGNGYMRAYHVEMLARDAKLLQIGGGTDEIQIVTIARALLKDGVPG